MSNSSQTTDVIIIGGGLQGCSIALHLALAGVKSVIIEKDRIGRHASSANAGGVRRLGRAIPEIPLAVQALGQWQNIRDLVDDDCGFTPTGQIKVAETQAELRALTARRDKVVALGYNHEEIIDQAQLRALLPIVAPHCVGAMWVEGDGHANPFATVQAFRRKALALGVRIIENTPVAAINKLGRTWCVKFRQGQVEAPIIVNCSGAWGGHIASMLGDYAPVEVLALMLMITDRLKPFVKPVVGAQGRALSFKQFGNGTVLIGGGHRGRAEPEANRTYLDMRGLAANAAAATALFPVMRRARIVRCWAGLEGHMPDGIPVIGKGAQEGVFHAFGFSGHGFALTPVTGKIIAELVTAGRSKLPIEAFAIDRFTIKAATATRKSAAFSVD